MSGDCLRVERGDRFKAMNDEDGYPAVRVTNDAWNDEPGWITVSAFDGDQERNVRDLADALVKLADNMARTRRGGL